MGEKMDTRFTKYKALNRSIMGERDIEKLDRNQEILEMRAKGYSLRQIAEKFDISFQRVSQICKKKYLKSNK